MTKIQQIVDGLVEGDSASLSNALKQMELVHDHELHFYLVLRDTLQSTAAGTRKAITLAQLENERRARKEVQKLTYRTTFISGGIGLVGVVLGFLLSYIF